MYSIYNIYNIYINTYIYIYIYTIYIYECVLDEFQKDILFQLLGQSFIKDY